MKLYHYIPAIIISVNMAFADTLSVWTAEADQPFAKFGCSVSSAGDVNGDGFDDAIITSAYYDNGQTDEGRVFVYYGSSAGLGTAPSWTAESDQMNANCYSGNGAGDVNGDGYDDVIVGAHLYDNGQTDEGKVFVYYGSATGLSLTPDWSAESDQAGSVFGISVASAGDVNSDGFYDVIIGANLYDNGQTDEGKVFVYYGSSAGLPLLTSWTFETDQAFSYLGLSVCSAGDVNNDGYDDIITAAQYIDNGQTDEGRTYVFFGSKEGLSLTPDWMTESDQAFALYGYSVWKAGDVNGDGFDDVLV